MKNLKIYKTDANLAYGQCAWLIRLKKSTNGHDYLCIDTSNCYFEDNYHIGKIVENLEDIYVEVENRYSIEDFPIYEQFLFKFFLEHFEEKE
jgi:hypothetical protein